MLKLWGEPRERGYAHGYLMGPEILRLIHGVLADEELAAALPLYELGVRGAMVNRFHVEPRFLSELSGMLEGIRAAVAPGTAQISQLNRDLDLNDLIALNTISDWAGVACSTFSTWGDMTQGGEMITARNLDYFEIPGIRETQLMIVFMPSEAGRKQWINLTWPGLIGAFTAMNEEGVTVSLHDAAGRFPSTWGPFVPRTLALREIAETAKASTAAEDAHRVLARFTTLRGNNVHVSAPFTGQSLPAVVLEYDGDETLDAGATLRSAENSHNLPQAIYCTNHYRRRKEPVPCERFDHLAWQLGQAKRAGRKLDLATAHELLLEVSVEQTLHSAIFLPNRRELFVHLLTLDPITAASAPAYFKLDELFRRR